MQLLKDIRLPQARKMIEGIISKSDLKNSNIMITGNNKLIIVVDETVLYLVDLYDLPSLPPIAFSYSDIIELGEDEYAPNQYLLSVLSNTYNYYSNSMSVKIASEPELRNDEEFEKLLKLKAADGARFFKIRGTSLQEYYIIPIFSGFPAINKTDKIGIDIYDLQDGHVLVIMNIFKKKINREINMCFRTLKLV